MPAPPVSRLAILAVSALWLAAGFLAYGATGHDDAHINFWAAWTLVEHGQILNYNGERVEQTTSLLLDLFTALFHLVFRLDLVTAGFLVDITASAGCCGLLLYLARQPGGTFATWPVALLLSCASFLLWTYGGMGATLAGFSVLAGIAAWQRWLAPAPGFLHGALLLVTTAMLALVRPEMPLVIVAVAACLTVFYWREKTVRTRSLQILLLSLLAAIAVFGWQKLYFDSWLPLPVVAKQSGGYLVRLHAGYFYLLFSSALSPLALLALLLVPFCWWQMRGQAPDRSVPVALPAMFITVYLAFVVTAGGDWMQAGRFLVPVLPASALLLSMAASRLRWRWLAHTLLAVVCLFQLGMQYIAVARLSHGIPAWAQYRLAAKHKHYSAFEVLNQEHLRDLAVIDHLAEIIPPLREKLGRPVVLMSGQAGMVFYYTAQRFGNDVQFRDLRGLVEGSLTLCPATRDVPRAQQGFFWSYRDFFAYLPALQQQCNINAPDIIYDINDMTQKLGRTLEPLGYTMIHQETGFPVENRTALPYNRLLAPNMIFVRTALMPLLDHPEKKIVNYHELPLQSRWPFQNDEQDR